jgi:hypothetical protein
MVVRRLKTSSDVLSYCRRVLLRRERPREMRRRGGRWRVEEGGGKS